jgi:hypothetical protein
MAEMFQGADDNLLARIVWFWPDHALPARPHRPGTAWAIEREQTSVQMNVEDGVAGRHGAFGDYGARRLEAFNRKIQTPARRRQADRSH